MSHNFRDFLKRYEGEWFDETLHRYGKLKDKVILVTGAAGGIGSATVARCLELGARVIGADLKNRDGAEYYKVDMRDPEGVGRLFEWVEWKHERLDGLICAAGVFEGAYTPVDEFPVNLFEKVMQANVQGAFLCAKYATPLLAESGGVLVLIASGAGVSWGSSSVAYGASKGAVNGLGMTLAKQLEPRGVRVNVVCPGNIETDMKLGIIRAEAERDGLDYDTLVEEAKLGDPMGVAKVLAWLMSDEAEYVRGDIFTR